MRKQFLLLLALFFIVGPIKKAKAQGEILKSFHKSEGLCYQKIQLCKDHKVFLEKGCELSYKITVGTWEYEGDTLVITPAKIKNIELVNRVDGFKEKGHGRYMIFRFFDYYHQEIPFYPLPVYNQSEGYPVFKIQLKTKKGKLVEVPIDKAKEGKVKKTKIEEINLVTLGEAYLRELKVIPKTEGKYNVVDFYCGLPAPFISNPEIYFPMEQKLRFSSQKDGLHNLANDDLEFKLEE